MRIFAATIRGGFDPDLTSINASLTKGTYQAEGFDFTTKLSLNDILTKGTYQAEGFDFTPNVVTGGNNAFPYTLPFNLA